MADISPLNLVGQIQPRTMMDSMLSPMQQMAAIRGAQLANQAAATNLQTLAPMNQAKLQAAQLQNQGTQINLQTLAQMNQARLGYYNAQNSLLNSQAQQIQAGLPYIGPGKQQEIYGQQLQNIQNYNQLPSNVAASQINVAQKLRDLQQTGHGPFIRNGNGSVVGTTNVGVVGMPSIPSLSSPQSFGATPPPSSNNPLNPASYNMPAQDVYNPSPAEMVKLAAAYGKGATVGGVPANQYSPDQINALASAVSSPSQANMSSSRNPLAPNTNAQQEPLYVAPSQDLVGKVEDMQSKLMSMPALFNTLKMSYQGEGQAPSYVGLKAQQALNIAGVPTTQAVQNYNLRESALTPLADMMRTILQGSRAQGQIQSLLNGLEPHPGESQKAYNSRLDAYQQLLKGFANTQSVMLQKGVPINQPARDEIANQTFDAPSFYNVMVRDPQLAKQLYPTLTPQQRMMLKQYDAQRRGNTNG